MNNILPGFFVALFVVVAFCCFLFSLFLFALATTIQHNPSCAVYQQTPGGKALVHRARMPSVDVKKKSQGASASASVFAAALPRSVVVEGTFQVRTTCGVGASTSQPRRSPPTA